ncbi:MAG TPA: TRAP transporter small permease [Burkholderiales bacterium]|nr:TRAP transporter small permease [Burkholderiales bacterium]
MASRRSALDLLIDALALVAAALLCALVALILVDVAARYLRWFSLAWGLEASEYMLYAITFLGAPWVLRERGHIAIELVVEQLPERVRGAVRLAADALGALVCALLLVFACRVLWRSYQAGTMVHKSFVFPEWLVYAGMPPVFLILLVLYLRLLARPGAR